MDEKVWTAHYDSWVPEELQFPEGTLYDMFHRVAQAHANKNAVMFFDAAATYRELETWVDAFAAALAAQGVKKGDRILISLPTSPQFIVAYFAIMKLGGVAVMLNPLSPEREIVFKAKNAAAMGFIGLDMFYETLYPAISQTDVELVVFAGIFDLHPSYNPENRPKMDDGVLYMRDLINRNDPDVQPADTSPNEPAVIIYTGGTTGEPKGVLQSHFNHIANSWTISTWAKMDESDIGMVVLPLFHGFGMAVMNSIMIQGGSLVLLPQFDIEGMLKQFDTHRATIMIGVPTMYTAVNNFPKKNNYDISSLRVALTGGAPLPLSVKKEFEAYSGCTLLEGLGLTESTCAVCCNPYEGLNKEGSIGLPMSNTLMGIKDLETGDNWVEPGESGEVVIKSPTVMVAYYNNPEATRDTIRDGWLHTGDIGRMDEDGYFYILDRKKEMIIASGFNVYPSEVENILQAHSQVLETAVIGVPDDYRGETVKAFIVPKPDTSPTQEQITEYCRENMQRYMVPKIIEFCDSLPKSPVGKILKKELKARELARADAS